MDEAKLSAFIAEYDDYITILIGLVLIAGSVKNWTGFATLPASLMHIF